MNERKKKRQNFHVIYEEEFAHSSPAQQMYKKK